MLFVEEGLLEAFDDNQILKSIPQGSLIGVTSVMDGTPFAYHIRAGKDSTLVKIDQKCLGAVLKAAPAWMLATINSIVKDMQPGGAKLRAAGVRLESLAIVESMDAESGFIQFREQES